MPEESNLKILLVEDDEDYIAIITDQLGSKVYEVTPCRSMVSALDSLQNNKFDVVLLDLHLPDSNDVSNVVRIQEIDRNVPIIVITAESDDEHGLNLVRLGAQDYLTKGVFSTEVLRRSISYAVERSELSQELEKAKVDAESAALQESVVSNIGRILSSSGDLEHVFEEFAAQLRKLIQFDRAWVMVQEKTSGAFTERYSAGLDLEKDHLTLSTPSSGSVSELIFAHEEGLVVSDEEIVAQGRTTDRAKAFIDAGLKSFISQPLKNMGTPIGLLTLASKEDKAYSDDDLLLIRKTAAQIAGPVAQAETLKELQLLAETQSALADLGKAISHSLDLQEIVTSAAPIVSELLAAPHITLNLVDRSSRTFTRHYICGPEVEGYPELVAEPLEGSTTERVVEMNSPLILTSAEMASTTQLGMQQAFASGVRSFLIVPLRVEGQAIGTIAWADYQEKSYTDANLDVAITISMQLAGAIANCELHKRTIQQAEEQIAIEKLEVSNRELKVANEVKSQIISNVSHELRTPLTSMLAFADMLNRDNEDILSEQYKVMVKMIRRAGRQLDLLIGDLLTMSRLQSGDFKLSYEAFDLSKLLNEISDLMSAICVSKNQEISLNIEGADLQIEADRARFAQVVQNIVSNASKYSPENSVITISAKCDRELVTVSVTDQGDGMTEQELEQLFKRFSRLDNDATRSEQGTGLGLSIVERLVSLHNGEVKVESELGKGTTFAVTVSLTQIIGEPRSAA